MGDSAFPNDETILLRTDGVSVKSIQFEGILTDRRIILVDRARNVLPQKDIPLDAIRQVMPGENAIRDPTLTFYVAGKNNETRQMVLTFTRESGASRARVRDEWAQNLEYYIPRARTTPGQPEPVVAPPKKLIIENPPCQAPAPEVPPAPLPESLFCIRCGNRVVSDSAFCNRCGAPIIPPASPPYAAPSPTINAAPRQPPAPALDAIYIPPLEMSVRPPTRSAVVSPGPDPIPTPRKVPEADSSKKPKKQGFFARLFAPKPRTANRRGESTPPPAAKPEKPRRSGGSGKKIILGVVALVVILAVIAAGVLVVYPMISQGLAATPAGSSSGGSSAATPVPTETSSSGGSSASAQTSWTPVSVVTTQAAVPQMGVQVHVSYLGGFKGTYGLKSDLQSVKSSGDRVYEVLNATGAIQANFEKTDSSTRHDLVVEIYKNGKLLSSGSTSASYGKVILAVDATTGVAQPVVTSASSAAATTTSAANTTVKTTTKVTTSATTKAS